MIRRLFLVSIAALLFHVSQTTYAAELSNVAYSSLSALPQSDPSLRIAYGPDKLQFIDVWKAPEEVTDNNGALIFIHGGCWLNAYDLNHARGFYKALSERGIDVYAVEYRRAGDEGGGWPGSRNDVISALQYLSTYWRDTSMPHRIALAGHSAGGHLALLAIQEHTVLDGLPLNKVIGLAAITDIARYAQGENSCQTATKVFMGGVPSVNQMQSDADSSAQKHVQAAYLEATPVIDTPTLPVILLQGDADVIVPSLHANLAGATPRIIKAGGHFDWIHPETLSFNAFYKELIK